MLEPWLEFGEKGELVVGPRAAFHNIPEQPILTQAQPTRLVLTCLVGWLAVAQIGPLREYR